MMDSLSCGHTRRASALSSHSRCGSPDACGNRLGRLRPRWMQQGRARTDDRLVVSGNGRWSMFALSVAGGDGKGCRRDQFVRVECRVLQEHQSVSKSSRVAPPLVGGAIDDGSSSGRAARLRPTAEFAPELSYRTHERTRPQSRAQSRPIRIRCAGWRTKSGGTPGKWWGKASWKFVTRARGRNWKGVQT
jgi:hypothetical protein